MSFVSFFSVLIETLELPEEIPLIEAELGDNVTFTCSSQDFDQALMYWYKFQYGYMIHTILKSSFGKFNEHLDDSRIYAVKKNNDKLILTIKNVSKEDEAAYFCQAGSSYNMEFINGIHLFVKGEVCSSVLFDATLETTVLIKICSGAFHRS